MGELSISTITIAEIYLGISLLPAGKRKKSLMLALVTRNVNDSLF